jgi:hypothetical protein
MSTRSRTENLRETEVRRRVLRVSLTRDVEVPGSAEVVLRPRPTDRRVVLVGVEVELDLALAPPPVAVHAPGEVGPDVLPGALDAVEDRVRCQIGQRVAPPPLRVQVALAVRLTARLIGDLEVDAGRHDGEILQRQARALAERHGPVRVEASVRVRRDGLGADLCKGSPTVAEEVAVGHLDRGFLGAVPVGA